jgi:hypothetical protein
MLKLISEVTRGNAAMLRKGVADVRDERMCHQHVNLPNHPAWTVGHLTMVRVNVAGLLGKPTEVVDKDWLARFNPGSTPACDAAAYPTKADLLRIFDAAQANLEAALLATNETALAGPHPLERLRDRFPTLGHLALTLVTTHDGLHIGQLTDWRRAEGLPRLL